MSNKALFIGNSYTHGVAAVLKRITEKLHSDILIDAVTPGGWTLNRHLNKGKAVERIESGHWDIVVLQEQSQAPTLVGKSQDNFFSAVTEFCGIIRKNSARPVLYETWGRKDGDQHHARFNPDYATMQSNLTKAYEKAGRDNDVDIIPVGQVWRLVRENHPELGEQLYSEDGSHPSGLGQWMIACVFLNSLFDIDLDSIPPDAELTEEDAGILRSCIRTILSLPQNLNP